MTQQYFVGYICVVSLAFTEEYYIHRSAVQKENKALCMDEAKRFSESSLSRSVLIY